MEPSDHVRPSRRRNQPLTPPTRPEIQAFLNRMRKTSFKRSSKGFKEWMSRFGLAADVPDAEDEQM
jgi:hypothetical protein